MLPRDPTGDPETVREKAVTTAVMERENTVAATPQSPVTTATRPDTSPEIAPKKENPARTETKVATPDLTRNTTTTTASRRAIPATNAEVKVTSPAIAPRESSASSASSLVTNLMNARQSEQLN